MLREGAMQQIEAAGAVVANRLTKNLTLLGSIGSIAPLLGLFGTVVGMIHIFASQQAGPSPQELARGISVALYCTAFGIIVAVPAVLAHRYFRRLVEDYLVDMEEQAERLLEFVYGGRRQLMRFRRSYEEEPEVNLIPLIDVLLIVLIFLAVSTTYSRFAELKIQLPSADATTPAPPPNVVNVAVTADGRYALEKTAAERNRRGRPGRGRSAKAAQGREDILLVINADAQAPHQAVISVMEAARMAGIVRISFATQRPAGRR